jgi:ABC-type multidrug transport system fused ATPase/permease subunit
LLHNKCWLLALTAANALAGFTRTVGASYLGRITDLLEAGKGQSLWFPALTGAVIMMSAYFFRFLAAAFCLYLTEKLALDTRLKLAEKLKRMDFLTYEQYKTGDIQSVFRNDVNNGANLLYILLSRILNNIFLFVFSVCYMLSISPGLTAVMTAMILSMGALNQRILKKLKTHQTLAQKNLGDITSLVESGYTAIDTIKSYSAAAYMLAFFRKNRLRYNDSLLRAEKVNIGRFTIYNLSQTLTIFGSLFFLGFKCVNGDMPLGQVLVYIYLIKQILVPVEVIFRWMSRVVRSNASWNRIYDVLNIPDAENSSIHLKPVPFHAADVSNISYSHDKAGTILREETVSLKMGELTGLLGRSGSGKTTLLKILLGLYRSPGAVFLVDAHKVPSLSGLAAYVSSADDVFPFSVYENIILANGMISREDCLAMIERLGFGNWIRSLPEGIDTPVGEKTLSGGQKQMIINARALLSEFPAVILDEPFSAMDGDKEKLLLSELSRQKKHRLLLVTSHREQTMEFCDKIVTLNKMNFS